MSKHPSDRAGTQSSSIPHKIFDVLFSPATRRIPSSILSQGGSEWPSDWIKSSRADYAGQPVKIASDSKVKTPFQGDRYLELVSDAKKYGVAGLFDDALDFAAAPSQPVVLQYEVKLTKGLNCGGAYLKLLSPAASLDQAELLAFDGSSRYSIMFGPDVCGTTNKVHVIFQYQNPVSGEWSEHHATGTPQALKDTGTHLYTLVVRPNGSFEVFIDLKSEMKGTLTEALTPPINPPEEIDDPTDVKPEDWVDEKRIKDPDATKPDDWDEDAPKTVNIPDRMLSRVRGNLELFFP